MDAIITKKVAVISKYAADTFTSGDWPSFGQITGQIELVSGHPRLLRALSFGDDGHSGCVIEVLNQVFDKQEGLVDEVIEHFDMEALNNVLKHSKATEVQISLSVKGELLHIRIADNGRGGVPAEATATGNGLVNMKERLRQ